MSVTEPRVIIDPKKMHLVTVYKGECEACGCFFEADHAPHSPWWWQLLPWNWIYGFRLRCPNCRRWVGMLEMREWNWEAMIPPKGGSGTAPPKG